MSYKLQWENPDENVIISNLSELYCSKHFADVTLVCKNQRRIKAHGVVLAANSDMFQEILENNEDFEILFDEVALEDIEGVLEILYTGETQVKGNFGDDVIALGKSLGFDCFNDLERFHTSKDEDENPLDMVIFDDNQQHFFNETKDEKKYKALENSFERALNIVKSKKMKSKKQKTKQETRLTVGRVKP